MKEISDEKVFKKVALFVWLMRALPPPLESYERKWKSKKPHKKT